MDNHKERSMNIDNMKRLLTHLELDGQKFNYGYFVGRQLDDEHGGGVDDELDDGKQGLVDLYHCGGSTVGCLAGMAAAIALVEDNFTVECDGEVIVDETAAKWLDLTHHQRVKLFYGGAMVDIGMYEYEAQALTHATPLEAAKVVQHWIDSEDDDADVTD
jgi:hypothetical protein